MTQVMIAHEKEGPRYISMELGIGPTAHALLRERVSLGWYSASDVRRALAALAGVDPKFAPWHFLASRWDFEYERVEIVDLENLAPVTDPVPGAASRENMDLSTDDVSHVYDPNTGEVWIMSVWDDPKQHVDVKGRSWWLREKGRSDK